MCDGTFDIARIEVVATESAEENAEKNISETAAAWNIWRDVGHRGFIVASEIERSRRRDVTRCILP